VFGDLVYVISLNAQKYSFHACQKVNLQCYSSILAVNILGLVSFSEKIIQEFVS